jgi:transposase
MAAFDLIAELQRFDPDAAIRRDVAELVTLGWSRADIATAYGVHPQTIDSWLALHRASGNAPYVVDRRRSGARASR